MSRKAFSFSLVLVLAGLGGCSSQPAKETKTALVKDKIQGVIQVVLSEATATDSAMNAGGKSAYLIEGAKRYRLFLRTPFELEPAKEYAVEGYNAQKLIDEIGDPDQGKNGYPLQTSCDRIVATAWPGLAFDVTDGLAATLRTRVKRYPARAVFLVTKISPIEGGADAKKGAAGDEEGVPEISVPADKQKALLAEAPQVVPAPLWEPTAESVRCKVIISSAGKIAELETGTQLCEIVPWAQYRYQPTVQRGKPVRVKTEVEVKFEPRKPKAT